MAKALRQLGRRRRSWLLARERRADLAYRCASWPPDGEPQTCELAVPLRFGNAGWRAHMAWRFFHASRVGPRRPDPVNVARYAWWALEDRAGAIRRRVVALKVR